MIVSNFADFIFTLNKYITLNVQLLRIETTSYSQIFFSTASLVVVTSLSSTNRFRIYSSKIETHFLSWCSWILPFTFGVRCRYRRHKVKAQQPPSNQTPEPAHQSKSHFLSCSLFRSGMASCLRSLPVDQELPAAIKAHSHQFSHKHTPIHRNLGKSLYARKWLINY